MWIPFTFVLASWNSVTNTCSCQLTMKTGFFGSHDLGASSHDNLVHCFESMMPYCRSRWLEIQRRRKTNGTQSHLRTHHQWPEDLSVGPLYLKPCHLQLGVGWMSLHEWIFNTQFTVPFFACSCGWIKVHNADNLHLCLLLSFSLYFWCRATNKIKKKFLSFSLLTPINILSVGI